MERDMLKNRGFKKLVERIKVVYISTIKELIRRGKKYLSLNPETKNTIRVSIDMDKYLSILEDIDIKKSKEKWTLSWLASISMILYNNGK